MHANIEMECHGNDLVQIFDEHHGCYYTVCKYQKACAMMNPDSILSAPNHFQAPFHLNDMLSCHNIDAVEFNKEAIASYMKTHK